tara:strand:- start:401 stop:592 length:192 start_codon:yes stop_codon:yes gene_type:complete
MADETPDISSEADKSLILSWSSLRKYKYDELNQDEMRYDDLINGTTTWQDAITAIKLEYPKPT